MKDYFKEALVAFPLLEKKVALWEKAPSWSEEMVREEGAIFSEKDLDALILLSELKKMEGDKDFQAMRVVKSLVKSKGLIYLSIPVGKEKLVDGSHRVYGEARMKELFRGWRPVGYFGYSYEDLLQDPLEIHEPIFVLQAR